MAEMVEQVARAICKRRNRFSSQSAGAHVDSRWRDYATDARTAIKAMRVPTEDMLTILRSCGLIEGAEDAWQAVIDAALK